MVKPCPLSSGASATTTLGETEEGSLQAPGGYALRQNYPDPFNPTTTIQFEIPEQAVVSLKVYNVVGQEVAVLADDRSYAAGRYEENFNASRLPSGVYYYRLVANSVASNRRFQFLKKMMLVR